MDDKRNIISVKQLTEIIKSVLENDLFKDVWVKGELSNFSFSSTGHLFFSMKDDKKALLKAVMWKNKAKKFKNELQNGDKILCHGYISVYPPSGEYRLIVDTIEKEGIGDFWKKFEELKNKLSKEGLFEEKYKKTIPTYPKKIGVVTAKTGAAIRDIINVISRRAPYVDIVVFPCSVQGDNAVGSITSAIKIANQFDDIDLLIVGRGGGSIEDLWPFNEEMLAYAIFHSKIPIISAVGHEVDFTISDFVADKRAPTPSAAAEIAVKDKNDLLININNLKTRNDRVLDNIVKNIKSSIDIESINTKFNSIINNKTDYYNMVLGNIDMKINKFLDNKIMFQQSNIEKHISYLKAISPENTLRRGYAIIKDDDNNIVASIKNTKDLKNMNIQFHDGILPVKKS